MKTALFPLNAVLCPGGKIPLRIFEARYLDMVKACLKEDKGFVIAMLKADESSNFELPFYDRGSLAKIVDFDQGEDGLLNIIVEGQKQVDVVHAARAENGLWLADIEAPDAQGSSQVSVPVPNQYEELTQVLKALVKHPTVDELNLSIDFEDSQQVGWRLTELLPLDNPQKQYLFELDDPIYRLKKISDQLSQLAS